MKKIILLGMLALAACQQEPDPTPTTAAESEAAVVEKEAAQEAEPTAVPSIGKSG